MKNLLMTLKTSAKSAAVLAAVFVMVSVAHAQITVPEKIPGSGFAHAMFVEESGRSTIDLSWDPVANVQETNPYVVRIRTKQPLGQWSHILAEPFGRGPICVGQSLSSACVGLGVAVDFPGTIYQGQVAGVNAAGRGEWSDIVEVTTATEDRDGMNRVATAPGTPADLTATAADIPGAIVLQWTAGSGDNTDYRVRWQLTDAGGGTPGNWQGWVSDTAGEISIAGSDGGISTATATASYTLTGLAPDVSYDAQVAGVNQASISEWTTAAATTAGRSFNTDASLRALDIHFGTLTPEFMADVFTYTADVFMSTETVEITAAANDENAHAIHVQTAADAATNTEITDGGAAMQTLSVGENTILITVTAEDAATTATYTIKVTRAAQATQLPPPQLPPPVLIAAATAAEDGSAGLAYLWDRVQGVADTDYRIQTRVKSPLTGWRQVIPTAVAGGDLCAMHNLRDSCYQANVQGFAAATLQVQIRAIRAGSSGLWSEVAEAELPTADGGGVDRTLTAPGMPTAITAETTAGGAIKLDWTIGGGDTTSHRVRWRRAGTTNWQGAISDATTHATIRGDSDDGIDTEAAAATYTLGDLNQGGTYEAQIAGVNGATRGEFSESVHAIGGRALRSDATLSALVISGGDSLPVVELTPAFMADIFAYTARVANIIAELTVTPTPTDANAKPVKLQTGNGAITTVPGGMTSDTQFLDEGENLMQITATAEDGQTQLTYVATITRAREHKPGPPQTFTATAGNESLNLDWAAPADDGEAEIISYALRWKLNSAAVYDAADAAEITDATVTEYEIAGLENDMLYDVQVAAANTVGISDYASAQATPAVQPPGLPQNLKLARANASLIFTWDAPLDDGGAEVTSYSLRWKTVAAADFATGDEFTVSDPTMREYAIADLTNDVEYVAQVAAVNLINTGEFAEARATPALPMPPSAPQNVGAAAGKASLQITWSPPNDDGGAEIISYSLRWKLSADADYVDANVLVVADADARAAVIPNLTAGAEYDVQVAAENPGDIGDYSDPAQGIPAEATPPSAPQFNPAGGVHRVTPADESLVVVWGAPGDDGGADIKGYQISWELGEPLFVLDADTMIEPPVPADAGTADVSAATRTYAISVPENGRKYDIKITANNAAGAGDALTIERVSPSSAALPPPSEPRNVRVTPGVQKLTVTWEHPASAGAAADAVQTYSVRWKIPPVVLNINLDSGGTFEVTAPATTHTIENLRGGSRYEVEVAAINRDAGLTGEYSPAAQGTPATPSTDARLASLGFADAAAIAPQFRADVLNYSAAVANDVAAINIAPVAAHAGASVVVDGAPQNLPLGETEITITVTAEDTVTTTTYVIKLTRLGAFNLDLDESGTAEAEDGIVVARYLLGLRGDALLANLSTFAAADANAIGNKIGANRGALDVDGDGETTAADGILIARYLLGVESGDGLTDAQTGGLEATVTGNISGLQP